MSKKQKVAVVGWLGTVEYPTLGKKFSADISAYPVEMRDELTRHGWKQKFGDAMSGKTAGEKFQMVQRIHDGLMTGQWELTGTPDLTPIICEAVARIKRYKLADVIVAATGNEGLVKTWGADLKVRAEILKIRAERAAKIAAESKDEIEVPGLK